MWLSKEPALQIPRVRLPGGSIRYDARVEEVRAPPQRLQGSRVPGVLSAETLRLPAPAHRAKRKPPLLAEAEPGKDRAVALDVLVVEVGELAPALSHELEEPSLRVEVVPVLLQVLSQVVDALGQDCDLDFR